MHRISDIDLRLLRVFKAIVDSGGLVGAQLALNLSQSTVSTQLRELEKRLGFRLCHRGRAGFSLTAAGRSIFAASEDLFAAADRFQNTASSVSGELKGVLRVSIVDAIISNPFWDMAGLLGTFNERARMTMIELSVDSPGDMEELISSGTKDIAIGPFFRRTAGITYLPIFQERHAIYCAHNHPLANRPTVSIEDLRPYPFVARSYSHRVDLERVGQARPGAVVQHMEAQSLLILSGGFIGFLPVHYAEFVGQQMKLHRVRVEEGIEYLSPFYLLTKRGSEDNIIVRLFLNRVIESLSSKNRLKSDAVVPPNLRSVKRASHDRTL